MSFVKAGALGLGSLKQNKESRRNFATLLHSDDVEELVKIIANASEKDIEYYIDRSCNIFFRGIDKTSGITETVLTSVLSGGVGIVAGGAYSILGTTTVTSSGFLGLGLFTTTATMAAPIVGVIGVGLGGIALTWGACKWISNSARRSGKTEHFDKTMQEGRWEMDAVRTLNPFVFMNEERQNLLKAYELLSKIKGVGESDKKEFLKLFSAEMIHIDDVDKLRQDKSMMKGNLDKVLESSCGRACRGRSLEHSVKYIQELEGRYERQR